MIFALHHKNDNIAEHAPPTNHKWLLERGECLLKGGLLVLLALEKMVNHSTCIESFRNTDTFIFQICSSGPHLQIHRLCKDFSFNAILLGSKGV